MTRKAPKRRKPGRPPSLNPRSILVAFRVTKDELRRLEELASGHPNVSAFLREVVLKRLGGGRS